MASKEPLKMIKRGVVSVSVADVHERPLLSSTVVTQALLGTPLEIVRRKADWFRVMLPDGYQGWMCDTLTPMTADEFAAWKVTEKIIVTADHAVCLRWPGPAAAPVSDAVAGNIFAVKRATGRFYRVTYPDGRTGYLPKNAVQPLRKWAARVRATPQTIVATAIRFRGVPYSWGGTSVKAFDCSGFVKTVYFLCGILLPRDADQQCRIGCAVHDPAPGDLLFFRAGAGAGRAASITHVGISLGGRRFLEASGDVHESSLDPADADFCKKRARTYLGARRILGAGEKSGVLLLRSIPYYRGRGA